MTRSHGTPTHGTLAHRLIADHLVDGRMEPGQEVGLRIDQTLTQDATGTLVMQELEALGLDRVCTEVSVPLPDALEGPVLLKCGDNVSTDEISPAGAKALPYRSNIPRLAEFSFTRIDPDYPRRAADLAGPDGRPGRHFHVGGENYGQGFP